MSKKAAAAKDSTPQNANEAGPGTVYEDKAWWNVHSSNEAPHSWLMERFEALHRAQQTRYDNIKKLIAIYEFGFRTNFHNNDKSEPALLEELNAYNAAQNILDTVHAKVCKNEIIPMPITDGGNYSERKRARNLQKALEGIFDDNRVSELKEDVVRDALVTSIGLGKVFDENDRIKIEFVPAEDIVVDDNEGRYRKPCTMMQTIRMDRYKVLALYGGDDEEGLFGDKATRREKILKCKSYSVLGEASLSAVSHDQIRLVEAWRLPSSEGAGDGRHTIAIDGCTLVDEPYECCHFHFAVYRPVPRMRSWWGRSGMYALAPSQKEYETLTAKIQRGNHRLGGSHLIASKGANVEVEDLGNEEGTLIEVDGDINQIREFNPTPVNEQTYMYKSSIPADMKDNFGISSFATSSEIPQGLQNASGKALQVVVDEEDGRMRPYFTGLDRWHVDVAQLCICTGRKIVSRGKSYKVKYRGKTGLEQLELSEVLLDEGKYDLKIFASNALARQPGARFQQLNDLLSAQVINIEQFRRLFGLPDLDAENELDTADTDVIDMTLDKIVLKGKYLAPQPFDNLQLAKQRAGKFYNLIRLKDGIPEDRLALVQQYIVDIDAEIQSAQASAPAAAPANQPGAPPPMGGTPPSAPPMAA